MIGTLTAPTAIVAGLYQQDGTLRMVGRSTSLTRAQSHAVAAVLTAATGDHPWPDTMAATRFGSGRDRVALTTVEPAVVVEVAADNAQDHGVWRHSIRVIRIRADLTVDDLPTTGEQSIPPDLQASSESAQTGVIPHTGVIPRNHPRRRRRGAAN